MNDSTHDGGHVTPDRESAPGTVEDESILGSSTPGRVVNLPIHIIGAIAAVVPIVYAPWPWLCLALAPLAIAGIVAWAGQCTRYELTSQRLRKTWGLLTRRGEEVALYRVEDTTRTAPLLYRLYGRSNVERLSTDRTAHTLTLRAIAHHEAIRNQIRERVEAMRRAKGVRLVE